MIRIHDPEQLDEWVKQGGRFVWVEESLADEIPVSFMLIAQVEKQKYFRHRGSSLGEVVDGQPMVVSSQKNYGHVYPTDVIKCLSEMDYSRSTA